MSRSETNPGDRAVIDLRRTILPPLVAALIVGLLAGCAVSPRTSAPSASPATPRTSTAARGGCLELSADPAPAGPGISVRRGAGSTCERLELELIANGMRDVFAASFDIVFDAGLVRYDGIGTDGSFLTGDGATVQALDRAEGGRAVIGVTRWQQTTGVDALEPKLLATLRFSPTGRHGESTLRFHPASMLGSEMPPQAKPEVTWSGGTLKVTTGDR